MTDFSKITRTTHTVRCRSANNQFFADVEVLDGIALTLPNGAQISYSLKAANPFITDKTGDGNGTGDTVASSTRSSHMQRYTGIANPSMCFDAEVCDAFTVTGPNNTQFLVSCPTPWWAAPGYSAPASERRSGSVGYGRHRKRISYQSGRQPRDTGAACGETYTASR